MVMEERKIVEFVIDNTENDGWLCRRGDCKLPDEFHGPLVCFLRGPKAIRTLISLWRSSVAQTVKIDLPMCWANKDIGSGCVLKFSSVL